MSLSALINKLPPHRTLNFLGFFGCACAMAFALFFLQHVMGLEPCPLCIMQRVAVITVALLFLLAALHNPSGFGLRIYGAITALAAIGGGTISARQIWLQHLPEDQVPACGPGLDYMMEVFPVMEALSMIFRGSGECAEVAWRFLGLSIPEQTILVFFGLLSLALFQTFRPIR